MTIIGYARVSTDGQSLQSQTEALHLAGCGRVYSEKQSGVYSDRPQLAKAIAALAEGDCLVVCKLDRLAYRQGRRNIQIAGGSVGRHNHAAWAIDAHCPRRTSGVRETSDLVEDC
jgi:hypothetical protein